MHRISVAGIDVDVVRKDIKNLHLGVYPPEDIALEVDAHGSVLIARVEGKDLLSIIHKDQISLAGRAAQEKLHCIHAARFVLSNADQFLILGAGVMLFGILGHPVANGKPGADVAVKLRRFFKIFFHNSLLVLNPASTCVGQE